MSESEKYYEVGKAPASAIDLGLQKKIIAAEGRLATLAQVVGADFGMEARFGQLGGGSYFNSKENSITLDPQILLDDKEYLAEFVAGHEGGHRAITRSLEQMGVPAEKAMELYKEIGFGYLNNCLEDCADNNWVGEAFAKFKDDSQMVYAEQFAGENAAMTTPEISRLIARLGYVPKFVSFGSEIIREWAIGEQSAELDEAVRRALQKTAGDAEECRNRIPGVYSKEGERLKKAKDRFRIIFEKIWPEFEKLVKMDVDREKMRQLAGQINKESGSGGEKGGGEDGSEQLPSDLRSELSEKTEENLREQLDAFNKELDKMNDRIDKAAGQEDKDNIAKEMAELLGEKESLEKGEKNAVPWDELSEELKEKLREIFDKLPRSARKQLEEAARKQLEELDDKLIEQSRGQLSEEANPPTHEEIEAAEEKKASLRESEDERAKRRAREKAEEKKLADSLRKKIEGELSEYDKTYREIAPLADEMFNRIHQIFLPKRHPRWEKGNPTGQRLDLAKVMQFQADRSLYDKLWERKTIPKKIDYRFTLLVDLSGSMSGEKISQTFRSVILLSEVLNRLGIKTEIFGFQDELIPYKDFDAGLSPAIRTKMATMGREVVNQGEHNMANWTSAGYALGEASEKLARERAKDSFLLMLTDGEPNPDPEHSGDEHELGSVVENIRKNTKQKLIGLGIGPGTGFVADYFPTSLPNLNIKDMPRMLGDLLEDMISHPEKYR